MTIDSDMEKLKTHTANGVRIEPGLRVFTNDLVRGTVLDEPPSIEPDGMLWWHVELDTGGRYPAGGKAWYDGWRMTTVHPFTREQACEHAAPSR